jgi:hypothetical protein
VDVASFGVYLHPMKATVTMVIDIPNSEVDSHCDAEHFIMNKLEKEITCCYNVDGLFEALKISVKYEQ